MYLRRGRDNFRNRLLSLQDRATAALRYLASRRATKFPSSGPRAAVACLLEPDAHGGILSLDAIEQAAIEERPYRWAAIGQLFSPKDAADLARTFPRDSFRSVVGNDGEKSYKYLSRSLVHMGAAVPSRPERLSPAWRALVADLLSDRYRDAISRATGLDLSDVLMEINAIRFGPGAWLGPHVDLKEKIATHILYFNEAWDPAEGGCLQVLRSRDAKDIQAEILPIVGNSALLVRSDRSWHAVSPVAKNCRASRRNINVIFHLPGSVSTMWPPGEKYRLRDYVGE